jgi:MGT family glycosyltransferase
MAHFAMLAPEAAGHLFPMGSLACELRRRGHQVTLVALPEAAPVAEQLQIPLVELTDDAPRYAANRRMRMTAGLMGLRWAAGLRSRFCWKSELILSQVPRVLDRLGVDGVLVDQTILAGGSVAEHLGLPFVTVCSALMWNEEPQVPPHFTGWSWSEGAWARGRNRAGHATWEAYMRPVLEVINRYRAEWHLEPLERSTQTISRYAQLSQLCPELDFPRRELAATCHLVGSLAAARPRRDDDFPWDRLDGRPLIFASLGTVRVAQNLPAFRKIAQACVGLDAQLVMSLGRWTEDSQSPQEQLGELPGNPLLVGFAPQLAILERATAMITHAGQNTTLEALHQGVPLVALPRSADQPALAARLAHAGVGLRASFSRFTPDELRGLISRVLTEDSFRDRAGEMSRSLVKAGGVVRAAEVVERVMRTGQPVTDEAAGQPVSVDPAT